MAAPRVTRPIAWLLALGMLLCGSGATCQRSLLVNPFAAGPAAPQVLAEGATRDQIIAAVNQNSARIASLNVTGAAITIPDTMGLPILSGNIAAERPGRFRLTAGTAITGQEIDMGSNDQLFWLWVRRNQPPAVYICRHDRFAGSNIRQVMPVEPSWFLAALGMVDLDPATVFDGPLPRGDGTVELRSWLQSASGMLQRVTVIDATRGWVIEQHVYDQTGTTLLASAIAESHRYDEPQQVSLPQRLSIQLPTTGLNFKIDLGNVQINHLAGDRQPLWALPTFEGYPQYDLGGAAPGTPLPGGTTMRQQARGVLPAGYSMASPATNPEAALYNAPSGANGVSTGGAAYQPLPQYGRPPYSPPSVYRR